MGAMRTAAARARRNRPILLTPYGWSFVAVAAVIAIAMGSALAFAT